MNVLITGADSGLGRELVGVFRDKGCVVYGTSVNHTQGLLKWDARESVDHQGLASCLRATGTRLHVLINNAGINAIRPFEEVTAEFLHEIFQVNTVGPIMLTQAMLKAEVIGPGSVVCNVISDAAWRPMRHSLAYNMSKAALDMATKQMARELTKPNKMTIFGVRPGKMAGTGMSRYIDREVMRVRGWTAQQATDYFVNNSVEGREFSTILVAKLVYEICTCKLPISGACLDFCG